MQFEQKNIDTNDNGGQSSPAPARKRAGFILPLVLACAAALVLILAFMRGNSAVTQSGAAGAAASSASSFAPSLPPCALPSVEDSVVRGDMERVAQSNIKALANLRARYENELAAAGWGNVLNLERIKKDNDLAGSRAMVIRAREITKSHQARINAFFDKFREDLAAVAPDEKTRREIVRGFEKNMERSKPFLQNSFALENKIIAHTEELFIFLSAKKGGWEIKGNKIVFADRKDQNDYEHILQTVIDYAVESEVLRREADAALGAKGAGPDNVQPVRGVGIDSVQPGNGGEAPGAKTSPDAKNGVNGADGGPAGGQAKTGDKAGAGK